MANRTNPFTAFRKIGNTLRSQKLGTTGRRYTSPTSLGVYRGRKAADLEKLGSYTDLTSPGSARPVLTKYANTPSYVEGHKYQDPSGVEYVWSGGEMVPYADWTASQQSTQAATESTSTTAPATSAPSGPSTVPKGDAPAAASATSSPGGAGGVVSGTSAKSGDAAWGSGPSSSGKGWDLQTAAPGLVDFAENAGLKAGLTGLAAGLTYGTEAIGPGFVSGLASSVSPLSLGLTAANYAVPAIGSSIYGAVAESDLKDQLSEDPTLANDPNVASVYGQKERERIAYNKSLLSRAATEQALDYAMSYVDDLEGTNAVNSQAHRAALSEAFASGLNSRVGDDLMSRSELDSVMNAMDDINQDVQEVTPAEAKRMSDLMGQYASINKTIPTNQDQQHFGPTPSLSPGYVTSYRDRVNTNQQAAEDAAKVAASNIGFTGVEDTYTSAFAQALDQLGMSPTQAESYASGKVQESVASQTAARASSGTGGSGMGSVAGVDSSSTGGNSATNAGAGTGTGGASENSRGNQYDGTISAISNALASGKGNSSSSRGSYGPGAGWAAIGLGDWANETFGTYSTPASSNSRGWGAEGNMNAGNSYGTDTDGNPNTNANDDDGGSIICTELYRQGLLPKKIWVADMRYARDHTSETTKRGYHFWARPCVRAMRRSKFWTRFWKPIAGGWAYHMAYKLGRHDRPNWMGRMVALTLLPLSGTLGRILQAGDWLSGLRQRKENRGTQRVL